LAAEVAFCKKEVGILHSEQATIETVATTQCSDIQRYLEKETNILEEVINKSQQRQKAEHSRFNNQGTQIKKMLIDLDEERNQAVKRVQKVENALGVNTDPMQNYSKPLATIATHRDSAATLTM
jgi:DNA-directed RNA polymerase subunit M/transcription elongation factor TFIIS